MKKKQLASFFILLPVVALMTLTASPLHSAVIPGEEFVYLATETSPTYAEYNGNAIASAGGLASVASLGTPTYYTNPKYGAVAAVDITLGSQELSGPHAGLFEIASFDVYPYFATTFKTPVFTDTTGVFFDPTTSYLTGDVTGEFIGTGDHYHWFDVSISEAGTWTKYNDHTGIPAPPSLPPIGSVYTDVAYGTYTAATPVPEPATVLLLGSGLVGLAGYARRKFFKK